MTELAKSQPFQDIAEKGAALYRGMKNNYEPVNNGKFLAIEVEAQKVFMGATSGEALDQARAACPGKLFYVVKIGFDSAETLAHSLVARI